MKICPGCHACFEDDLSVCPSDDAILEASIPGSRIIDSRYRLDRAIGAGAMGVVFRARHLGLECYVALKIVRLSDSTDADVFMRFRLEATTLGRLKHANIVDVTDSGVDPRGLPYLVMEYLEGRTLAEQCHNRRPTLDFSLRVLGGLAAAVDFAHKNGVVHRDLKPANVFLVDTGGGEAIPKVVDFGLAQIFSPAQPESSSSVTTKRVHAGIDRPSFRPMREVLFALQEQEVGCIAGTPGYMAPEILRSEPPSPSADIFSLGVIAYEILTGVTPPWTSSDRIADALRIQPLPPSKVDPALPPDVDVPVLQMLSEDPGDRPASATLGVDRIRTAVEVASARQRRLAERPRRLRLTAGWAVAVMVTAIAAWSSEIVEPAERRLIDARMSVAPAPRPDSRLLVVSVDEASLSSDARALATRADEFGTQIDEMFRSGASAVAVDLLLPESWARSPAFANAVLRHADRLTLAALSPGAGAVVGPECARGVITEALGSHRATALFGLVNLLTDPDGLTRRSVTSFRDVTGERHDTFARRAARTLVGDTPDAELSERGFLIDFRVDPSSLRRLPWGRVADMLHQDPDLFRERLVLIGGDFEGSGDEHRVPGRSNGDRSMPGLVVQALIVNTIVGGFPIRAVSTQTALPATIALSLAVMAAIVFCDSLRWPLRLMAIGIVVYIFAAVGLFYRAGMVFPIVGPLAIVLVATGIAAALRKHLGAPASTRLASIPC